MATLPPLPKPRTPGVKVKKPNLPKTTKIDTVSGKGAPGGFKGASTKNPAKEADAAKGDISKLQAQSQASGAQSGVQSQATNLEEKRNLDRAIASKQTELKVANRAPNFSKGTVVTG
jgi:hypothetical protein